MEPARLQLREVGQPHRARRRRSRLERLRSLALMPGFGTFLVLGFLLGVGSYGFVVGGGYAELVETQGALPDIIARAAGFGLETVTITGARELSEKEILDAAGIGPHKSLIFLDAKQVRAGLEAMPLVKEASVSKLFPDRLLIEVVERQPFALWQKDGHVRVVAADGMAIDDFRDGRFANLPLVVGDGANERLDEFASLLTAADDLRPRIRAGILVAKRRWTLQMTNGVEVALPELNPQAAVARLAQLQRDAHILDKDILSIDLRVKGRVVARLSEEAAQARAQLFAHKTKAKGGQT